VVMKCCRRKDVVQERLEVSPEVGLGVILDDLHRRLEAVHSANTSQSSGLRDDPEF